MRGRVRAPLTRWCIGLNTAVALASTGCVLLGWQDVLREVMPLSWAGILQGRLWQLLTYPWVHAPLAGAGVLHIVCNMLTLHFIGPPVEMLAGRRELAWVYLGGGLAAGVAALAEIVVKAWLAGTPWEGTDELVGASGAVCAVLGFFARAHPTVRVYVLFLPFPMTARTAVYGFLGFSVAASLLGWLPFIAHMAHVGGVLWGWGCWWMWERAQARRAGGWSVL